MVGGRIKNDLRVQDLSNYKNRDQIIHWDGETSVPIWGKGNQEFCFGYVKFERHS